MNKWLPDPTPHCAPLFSHLVEITKWEALKTAIELGVFDTLSEPAAAVDVAGRLSIHPENTEHLLNALAAMGYLTKKQGRFRNAPLAETYLTSGRETSLGDFLLYQESWFRPMMDGTMAELLRNGPPAIDDVSDETIWETAARASVNHARSGRAQKLAAHVTALPEFPSFSRILDLGAGPGIMGIAVTLKHPTLHCVLYDQPVVCKVADDFIAEYDLKDRMQTRSGDYMNDPIGDGYDFVMANYTLNFYRETLDEIFGKVYRALNPGGVFLVTTDGLTDEKTAPTGMVVSWLSTALRGNDLAFERGVIADAMIRAGFVSTQTQALDDPAFESFGTIDMIVGRKSPE